jgi:hypothetical protein
VTYDEFVRMYESMQVDYGRLNSAKRVAYVVHSIGTPANWTATIKADLLYEKQNVSFAFTFHKEGVRWVLFGAQQL